MMKYSLINPKIYLPLCLLAGSLLIAQPVSDKKIDGVAAVVGSEIVLTSDLQRDYQLFQQRGAEISSVCELVDNTLLQKMVLHHAKNDTLIRENISKEVISNRADQMLQDFLSRGTEEQVLNVYGVHTTQELKKELEIIIEENAFVQQKQEAITREVDASPEEVSRFFEANKEQLPDVNEEVEIAQIVIYPELTPEHEQEIKDKLLKIKKEVEEGASFATKAILVSEDPGSASEGGLYKNIKRGTFVPEFDAVAFNLDEGEISDPVKTEFGYHIIMLEKRLGQSIDVRHILIIPKPTKEEMDAAYAKLDSIRTDILKDKITFKEAAKKYSEDKLTRYNAGVMTNPQSGEDRFERSKLPTASIYALAGRKEGEITRPFEDEFEQKKAMKILQLNRIIPAHQIDLATDYTRLKNFTINQKKQEVLYEWIDENLKDTFISIDDDYSACEFEFNWKKESDTFKKKLVNQ